jgi:SAM-dependent methyltransferase
MALHVLAITLSSFLLFLVQPIIGKRILPWFGGTAGVWTTCLVFFQFALLAGYAYGDLLTRRVPIRRQVAIHLALVLASLLVLPIVPPEWLKPEDATSPTLRILLLLTVTIGLPYFVLSTTGPLVQAWTARAFPSARVYRLYALSNAASIVALAAYPFAVEPNATVRVQAVAWSAGYVVFAVALAAAAWMTLRGAAPARGATAAVAAPSLATPSPAPRDLATWFGLAMLGSTLLLAVTAHLTQDVAAVPFLWVMPLSIYLLTFVLCFDGQGWYLRRTFTVLAAVAAVAMLAASRPWGSGFAIPLWSSVPLYGVGLFAACMYCHGELARRKPPAAHLTRFYLMLSLGGAAGGLFVGVVAPVVFSAHLEVPLALCALALVAYVSTPGRLRLVGAAAVVATVALSVTDELAGRGESIARTRSFYGTLRIKRVADAVPARVGMVHGVTLHGEQLVDPARRNEPTTYFGVTSGVGRTFAALGPGSRRVGIVGVGVGTLAAYGRLGDVFRYYELDPDVVRLARAHFSFLDDSPAIVELALGDGRLSLEREPPQRFDLLVLDAFSSDAIPAHLLTVEAGASYARHLAPAGVLAFHVSNRYLDLAPVVQRLAEALGLEAVEVIDRPPNGNHLKASEWMIVSANRAVLDALRAGGATPVVVSAAFRPWTDDFNDLFGVLRRADRNGRAHASTMANERKGPGTGPESEQQIGPSGGPPDDRERQYRGSTPTEDVLEQWIERGEPKTAPAENPKDEDAGRS